MDDIEAFEKAVDHVYEQYAHGDIGYEQAKKDIESHTFNLFKRNATNFPDSVRDAAFFAYTELQRLAFQLEDIKTKQEVRSRITDWALTFYKDTKPSEKVKDYLLDIRDRDKEANKRRRNPAVLANEEHHDDERIFVKHENFPDIGLN